jgi:hypothetical protein
MNKLTFYFWVTKIFTGRTDFSNHNSAILQFCTLAALQLHWSSNWKSIRRLDSKHTWKRPTCGCAENSTNILILSWYCFIDCVKKINLRLGNEILSFETNARQLNIFQCRASFDVKLSKRFLTILQLSKQYRTKSNKIEQNKTKQFSLNRDKIRVLVLIFIFTGNDVVFRQKWTR